MQSPDVRLVTETKLALSQATAASTYVALRGAWAANVAYPKNSLVIWSGVGYVALNDVPARSAFTPSDWQSLNGS